MLRRFVRDPDVAEDLLQEVLWSAWRNFADLDPDRDPLPWLRTLAVHRAIDHQRRAKARPPAETGHRSVDEAPARTEPRGTIDLDLSALREPERAAILLHYQEGRSVAEIAAELGATSSAVKVWLFRARERLRPRLAPPLARPGETAT